jgi:hypothetical protein
VNADKLELARKAVTDECGSRLCHWIDLGTERVCTLEAGCSFCMCENVARAVLAAVEHGA